ncbi:endolytic transglycosylase MltG [Microbacterium pygmaeum]|uniref:Endolytic murein transglycosylase n=1 Tax=Microbacterium pygmaeum TaxID=370764 RepID=A0A1G8B3V6_9MICO|nr:endolytic transglycosylase MltG [Microbacterium pygmaeum]SDH27876.1 UPF0755 protein [Microbacterium pygmaeum]
MPDSPSPFDDPFADLFGKLPDPRARERRPVDEGQASSGSATPLSRRAAREAAAASAAPSDPAPVAAPRASAPPQVAFPTGAAAPEPLRTPARSVATATLDDLFTGAQTTDHLGELPPPPDRRKRRIGGWIALAVVLVLLGGMAAGGLWVWNTYEDKIREFMGWEEPKDFEAGMANGEVLVTIEDGDTGSPISQRLYDSGVTKTSDAFYDYLIDTGQNPTFQPGAYALQYQMTSEAALEALLNPANKRENTAQIPEGFTVDGTLERLAEGTGIPLEEFQSAVADPAAYGVPASTLEGWLFPATYTFDPGVTPTQMIQTMVDRTVQSLDTAGVPVEDRERILTVASIIQREARFEDDFYKVSRVIENRLDPENQETFGKLQMDSTAQYGYGEMHDGTVSTSQEALDDPNPWNTYYNTGLPIGPIANPGDLAIDAAMHPADGDWLYFVTVNLNTGETVFTTNIDDHNAAVAQWQAWCTDNPDAGC